VDMEMTRLITPKHKALCKGRVVDQHAWQLTQSRCLGLTSVKAMVHTY
jgi:hypothetical protein